MDIDCLCNDESYSKASEGCVIATCNIKQILSEYGKCLEPPVPTDNPPQLLKHGKRRPARCLPTTPDQCYDGLSLAFSLPEHFAL